MQIIVFGASFDWFKAYGCIVFVGVAWRNWASNPAMGGLDNKIHLYCGQRTGKFVRACELKGHTDWIRNLDLSLPLCKDGELPSVLLASSSQNKGIRMWKLGSRNAPSNSDGLEEISFSSYIEGPKFVVGTSSYQIFLESLLIGHEDWVYSVEWQPPLSSSIKGVDYDQPQNLLSVSMDKTMMIWQPGRTTGIWMNMVTVGELSLCALEFYGGHWSPNADAILAMDMGGLSICGKTWELSLTTSNHIRFTFAQSEDQLADIFSKTVCNKIFHSSLVKLGIKYIFSPV